MTKVRSVKSLSNELSKKLQNRPKKTKIKN